MAGTKTLEDLSTLRELIFDFYAENDPAKLRSGLDVNGMAEWTLRKGMENLNELLVLQYGKALDTKKKLGTVQDQVAKFSRVFSQAGRNQLSQGESSSGNTADKEKYKNVFIEEQKQKEELAERIEEFYTEHDPSKLNDVQVDALVNAAMIHGIDRINKDLLDRYGTDLDGNIADNQNQFVSENEEDELDELKVRQELRIFYKKHDPAYLERPENLDKVIDLMYSIGQKAVYEKLFKYYGERVESTFLEHQQKKKNGSPQNDRSTVTTTRSVPNDTKDVDSYLDDSTIENSVSAFDNIDEFRADLIRYYQKHDPEEIENIDDVIELGMDIGIMKLNESMHNFYGESLKNFLKNEKLENPNARAEQVNKKLPVPSTLKNAPRLSKLRKKVNPSQFHELINEKMNTKKYKTPPETPPRKWKKGIKSEDMGFQAQKGGVDDMIALKQDLITFYNKYDERKLECLDQIMKLGEKLGREELNFKLINFYGVGLDDSDSAEVSSQLSQKVNGKNRKSKKIQSKISMQADDFLNEELSTTGKKVVQKSTSGEGMTSNRSILSGSLKLRRKKKGKILSKRTSGNDYSSDALAKKHDEQYPSDQVDYDDLTKLRADLFIYYKNFDEQKCDDIDQIVQLAKRIGRNKLDKKLLELYGTGLDDYIESLATKKGHDSHNHENCSSHSHGHMIHKVPRSRKVRTATLKLLSVHVENSTVVGKKSISKQTRRHRSRNPPKERVSVNELFQETDLSSFRGEQEGVVTESEVNPVDSACPDYNLDMEGDKFGVCVCGHSKVEHVEDDDEENSVSF